MLCKPCCSNRIRRNGGQFGLCWQHKKTKCRICRQVSAGKLYCISCEHGVDIKRWKSESFPYPFQHDDDYVQIKLRKERLYESRFHVHRAVEVFYRAMVLAIDAIWGGVKDPAITGSDTEQKEFDWGYDKVA